MKIITMTKEDFDDYSSKHKYRNFYQTSMYGDLMSNFGFHSHYFGFLNNSNELVGASLLLYKEIFMGYKYAYAPRGFLLDYTNANFIIELTERIKKLLFKQKFVYIKIDPLIHCSERKSDGEVISYNPEINDILEIMKKSNYIHHGFNQYFETTKSRWNAVIKMTMNNEKLFVNLNKNIRNKIRKSINKGVEIYQGTREDIPTFFEFIKKKHNRPLSYYQKLENIFTAENVEFYFAKINPEIFVINSKNKYEKELDRNEELNLAIQTHKGMDIRRILNEKMESDKLTNNYKLELIEATKLLQDHPEGITIGACCIIKYDKGIYLLIDGFNQKYSKFNACTRLKWEIIKKYNQKGYHFFNLNAIVGEFKNKNKFSGLNESKLGFHSTAIEYIGEFDYIINKPIYTICRFGPIRKHINKKAE